MDIELAGGYRVDAVFKGRTIKTDQPVDDGGDGSAPEPFDLFLASIGTCVGVYVLDFCLERKISTEGLGMHLAMHRNPDTRMIEKIIFEVKLPGGFPEKYRDAIVRVVNLCTVKKHFEKPPEFETVLK
jgi:ribosomal protein S12 methylthiotransferase accessory factor